MPDQKQTDDTPNSDEHAGHVDLDAKIDATDDASTPTISSEGHDAFPDLYADLVADTDDVETAPNLNEEFSDITSDTEPEFSEDPITTPSNSYEEVEEDMPMPDGLPPRSGSGKTWLLTLLVMAVLGSGAYISFGPSDEESATSQIHPPIPMHTITPDDAAITAPSQEGVVHQDNEINKPILDHAISPKTVPMTKDTPLQKNMDSPQVNPSDTTGQYTLQLGAFLFQTHLDRMKKTLQKLHIETSVTQKKQQMPMIRLRVGVFPPDIAKEKFQQVKQLTSGAFFITQSSGQVVVYAGSYFRPKGAKREAQLLEKENVHTEEEKVQLMMPIQMLQSGIFEHHDQAEKKRLELQAAGVDVFIKKI